MNFGAFTPTLAVVCFATGIGALWYFVRLWNKMQRTEAQAGRAWKAFADLLHERRQKLPAFLSVVQQVAPVDAKNACRAIEKACYEAREAEQNGDALLFLTAEQAVSRLVATLSGYLDRMDAGAAGGVHPMLRSDALAVLRDETRHREAQVASGGERYNDVAETINVYRRAFPALLLARALFSDSLPLFAG